MKKLTVFSLSFLLIGSLLSSCSSSTNTSEEDPCEKLIAEYELFCDDYLTIITKIKANPADMSAVSDFNEMQTKASKMGKEAKACDDPKYNDRMMKLSTKMMQAASGL